MSIMGESSGKGRTVIEGEFRLALRELKLLLEGLDLLPKLQNFDFLFGEVGSFGNYK